MAEKEEVTEVSEQEVWNVIEYMTSLYSQLKGFEFYDTNQENKNLIQINNSPLVANESKIRESLSNYVNDSETLQRYSEFMNIWDGIYHQVIDYKTSLLSFDINRYCINIKDKSEYSSKEYKDDVRRVKKFLEHFNAKQEFKNITKNMCYRDAYFVWLRDSYGSYDEEAIELEDNGIVEKKNGTFALQTMPQSFCKITGEFSSKDSKGKGFLWDFNMNYFNNATVNILNYDPSLIKSFNDNKKSNNIKSFIMDDKNQLNKTNNYMDDFYVRTKVNNGAWCFKFSSDNFNIVPPFAYLLKTVINNDFIEKLQKDKDLISANAIILGEMKTRDKEDVGNNKNAFTIDPKQIGTLLNLSRKMVGNSNIKQIALPLEETRLYQFADNNSNMYKNQLSSSAGLGAHNSSVVFTTDKLSQEEAQIASTIDYHSIADMVYPQFETFLNFFVNKKTKKYKFRFRVSGSTLPFLRDKNIDNHIKFIDKGLQLPIGTIGTLLGYEYDEYEAMVQEAKYGGEYDDNLFLLLNSNTSKDGSNSDSGRPTKDSSELADNSREYI